MQADLNPDEMTIAPVKKKASKKKKIQDKAAFQLFELRQPEFKEDYKKMNTPNFKAEETQLDVFSIIQTDLNPDDMTLPKARQKKKKPKMPKIQTN